MLMKLWDVGSLGRGEAVCENGLQPLLALPCCYSVLLTLINIESTFSR